jgi:hypothetical protein
MLHFLTAAPIYVVREIMSLAHGWVEDVPKDAPTWAECVVHVDDTDAFAVMHALRDWRIEGRRPAKVLVNDPTFALAAAAIDRSGGSTPAPAFAQ